MIDPEQHRKQLGAVWRVMHDRGWWTLRNISKRTGYPEQSVSARIRDFRKERFGGHTVDRIYQGDGVFIYRLIPRRRNK